MSTSGRLVLHHDGHARVVEKLAFVRDGLPALWADDAAAAAFVVEAVIDGADAAVVDAVADFAVHVVDDEDARVAIAAALVTRVARAAAAGDDHIARAAAIAADRVAAVVDDVVVDTASIADAEPDGPLVGVVVDAGVWRLSPTAHGASALPPVLFAPWSVSRALGPAGRAVARAVCGGAVDVAAAHGVRAQCLLAIAGRRAIVTPDAPWDIPLLASLLPPLPPAEHSVVVTGHLEAHAKGLALRLRLWRRPEGTAFDEDVVVVGDDAHAPALALEVGRRVATLCGPRRSAAAVAASTMNTQTNGAQSAPHHLAEKAMLLPALLAMAGQLAPDAIVAISPALQACLRLLDSEEGSPADDDADHVAVAAAVGAAWLGRTVSRRRARQVFAALDRVVARGDVSVDVATALRGRLLTPAAAPTTTTTTTPSAAATTPAAPTSAKARSSTTSPAPKG